MAKTKQEKQEQALERLKARLAEAMNAGRTPTVDQRLEFNTLTKALGLDQKFDASKIRQGNPGSLKQTLLRQEGSFTWCWGYDWFIETKVGNFHWKDPSYNGDNTMTMFDGTFTSFCKKLKIPTGRDKGSHIVKDYCGEDFIMVVL